MGQVVSVAMYFYFYAMVIDELLCYDYRGVAYVHDVGHDDSNNNSLIWCSPTRPHPRPYTCVIFCFSPCSQGHAWSVTSLVRWIRTWKWNTYRYRVRKCILICHLYPPFVSMLFLSTVLMTAVLFSME